MTTFARWAKFNLVGAMGMAVQLAALALFGRCAPRHYLCASAAAIEITLLHNFVWHRRYTWRDRCDATPPFRQFLRFQLSNGLVSIAGNLVLTGLLVGRARLPILLANAIAICCCSAANFYLVDNWVICG